MPHPLYYIIGSPAKDLMVLEEKIFNILTGSGVQTGQ